MIVFRINMKNLIADTIEKIKEKNIRPEPRWKYLAKKYSNWLPFFAAVLFGAAAFSAAYFLVSELDWDLYVAVHRYSLFYYLSLIPYIWIMPFAILVFFSFFGLRKTENGYKYSFLKIILLVLGSLIVFGGAMAFSGLGGKINRMALRGFPGYGKLIVTKEAQWSQPEKGLLAGVIDSVSKNSIGLRDFAGEKWQVAYGDDMVVRPSVNLKSGEMIKAIGRKEGSQAFHASEIRPWQGNGQMKKKNNQMNGRGK